MKILIIEDDLLKAGEISKFINGIFENKNNNIEILYSFQTGMKAIIDKEYNMIILDMSIPNFNGNDTSDTGKYRHLGGRDILREMKRKKANIPTIVVTQFNVFGEGNEQLTFNQLDKELAEQYFENYNGMVYYNASEYTWKENLEEKIKNIIKKD